MHISKLESFINEIMHYAPGGDGYKKARNNWAELERAELEKTELEKTDPGTK